VGSSTRRHHIRQRAQCTRDQSGKGLKLTFAERNAFAIAIASLDKLDPFMIVSFESQGSVLCLQREYSMPFGRSPSTFSVGLFTLS
jgi:hypothetical protein